jgi:hypothetical protein
LEPAAVTAQFAVNVLFPDDLIAGARKFVLLKFLI